MSHSGAGNICASSEGLGLVFVLEWGDISMVWGWSGVRVGTAFACI